MSVDAVRRILVFTEAGWRIGRRQVTALGQAGLAAGRLPGVFAGFGGKGPARGVSTS